MASNIRKGSYDRQAASEKVKVIDRKRREFAKPRARIRGSQHQSSVRPRYGRKVVNIGTGQEAHLLVWKPWERDIAGRAATYQASVGG